MRCCSVCFDDVVLADKIHRAGAANGTCSYCGAINQTLVSPKTLQDDFEAVFGAYREIPSGGHPFSDLLRDEWGLFPHLNGHPLRSLLDDILGAGFHAKLFSPAKDLGGSKTLQWDKFCEEIKFHNRFFPNEILNQTDLKDLLDHLKTRLEPNDFYRARVEVDGKYLPERMGKPPASLCGGGRANPVGIPYFYIASDPPTAVAEVRPHPGDRVTVATFCLRSSLTVLDLRSPRKTISPFGRDQDQLTRLRSDMEFLDRGSYANDAKTESWRGFAADSIFKSLACK